MLRNKLGQFLLPALAGILGFCAFPKLNLAYLAWISAAPLVVFVYQCRTAASAFWGGLLAGVLQQGGLLLWIPAVLIRYGGLPAAAAWVSYVFLICMLAIFPAVACAVTRYFANRLDGTLLLAFPLVWVAMEYSLSYVPFGGFPWLLTGYSQTNFVRLIQIADLTGVYGVSFLVLWFNASIAWMFLRRKHGRPWVWPMGVGVLVLAFCLLYGTFAMHRWSSVVADHGVAMIQGNLSSEDDWQSLRWKYQDGYCRMADRLRPGDAELLLLPEAPSPVIFQQDGQYRESMQGLARRFSLGLIFSNIGYEDTGADHIYFNSAFFMNHEGDLLGRYDKIHLVPFGEYIPSRSIFSFAETISKDVGDFHAGSEYRTVSIQGEPINAMICFEAVFPQIARRFVDRGSRLMVNLTNDGWYGRSAAPYQHLLMCRWRALENRRFLLRATNSGISAVIDPLGNIRSSTNLLTEELCLGRFAFIEESSFYSRHGDWFAGLCAIITLGFFVYCLVSQARDRRMQTPGAGDCQPPGRSIGE
jgi:apolipoprotein N-acyltransferase